MAAGSGAALLLFVILKYRRRAPFPFAGVPIVAGDAALDHLVAPLVARHDEGGQVAEAKAKRCERRHDDELQQVTHRTISGSFTISAAIRHASSQGAFFDGPCPLSTGALALFGQNEFS